MLLPESTPGSITHYRGYSSSVGPAEKSSTEGETIQGQIGVDSGETASVNAKDTKVGTMLPLMTRCRVILPAVLRLVTAVHSASAEPMKPAQPMAVVIKCFEGKSELAEQLPVRDPLHHAGHRVDWVHPELIERECKATKSESLRFEVELLDRRVERFPDTSWGDRLWKVLHCLRVKGIERFEVINGSS